MKIITIEDLEQLTPGSVTIVDVRPADTYQRGTFEGAINVPMKELLTATKRSRRISLCGFCVTQVSGALIMWNCSVPMDMMREILPEVTAHICVCSWSAS